MSSPKPSTGTTAPRGPAGPRDQSLDVAKGIGIVLVVLGHVLDGLIASGFFAPNKQWPSITVTVIYLFHMPLFFVVSGYLASMRHRPAGTTVKKLIPTIVYPYFLWSILEGLTLIYLSSYTNNHASLAILYRIPWNPIVPYWFLYSLFLCHVMYLAIQRYSSRIQLICAVIIFLIPICMAIMGVVPLLIVTETVRGFLFFVAGVVAGHLIQEFDLWVAVSTTMLFAFLAVLQYQSQLQGAVAAVVQLAPAFAGIVATLAWSRLMTRKNSWIARTLAFWGRYSMSIYVIHIFVTAGTRIGLQRLNMPAWHALGGSKGFAAVVIELGLATLLGVLLPLAVNRIASGMNLDRWLGLQHMERKSSAGVAA